MGTKIKVEGTEACDGKGAKSAVDEVEKNADVIPPTPTRLKPTNTNPAEHPVPAPAEAEPSLSQHVGDALSTVYGHSDDEPDVPPECGSCGQAGAVGRCPGCGKGLHDNRNCSNTYQDGIFCLTCTAVSDNQFAPQEWYSSQDPSQESEKTPPKSSPAFPSPASDHSCILIESSPEQHCPPKTYTALQQSGSQASPRVFPAGDQASAAMPMSANRPMNLKQVVSIESYGEACYATGVEAPGQPGNVNFSRAPRSSKATPRDSAGDVQKLSHSRLLRLQEQEQLRLESLVSPLPSPQPQPGPSNQDYAAYYAGSPAIMSQAKFCTPPTAYGKQLTTPSSQRTTKYRPRTLSKSGAAKLTPEQVSRVKKRRVDGGGLAPNTPQTQYGGAGWVTVKQENLNGHSQGWNSSGGIGVAAFGGVGVASAGTTGTNVPKGGNFGGAACQGVVRKVKQESDDGEAQNVLRHQCSGTCPNVLPEYRPQGKIYNYTGKIPVDVDAYNEALGTVTGRPINDSEAFAYGFAKNLAHLMWDPTEFRGHNIGGCGRDMYHICDIRLKNLISEVKKVFPIATNIKGLKRHPWIPKFLSVRLNRHFRTVRCNEKG